MLLVTYAECHIMPFKLSVVMLSVIMLSVVALNLLPLLGKFNVKIYYGNLL